MKTNYYLALCILFVGCADVSSEGVLFLDVTNKTQRPITSEAICCISGITANQNGEHLLHIKEITGYDFALTKDLYFSRMKVGSFHPRKREQELAMFKERLDQELKLSYSRDTVIYSSSIYNELIRSLNALSDSKAEIKYAVIVSDMCENTEDYSVYRQEDLELLINHPVEVERRLIKRLEPKDLTGISIHIVFHAGNDLDNARFSLMGKFFRDLLERYHAKVTIQANLSDAYENVSHSINF